VHFCHHPFSKDAMQPFVAFPEKLDYLEPQAFGGLDSLADGWKQSINGIKEAAAV
jgi:hypothetical protein